MYIQTDREKDQIVFSRPRNWSLIEVDTREPNLFNTYKFPLSVGTFDLILFPSHLQHEVPTTTSGKDRISLSFNTFVKGDFGQYQNANLLVLK